jgi:hypothetical protein
MDRWKVRNGFARIFPFSPALGAAYYVTGYIANQFADWDISDNLEAFRIQQTILPLVGQQGSPSTEQEARQAIEKTFTEQVETGPVRQPILASEQLPIEGFKELDLSEVDLDPVRASFHLQTKRKK